MSPMNGRRHGKWNVTTHAAKRWIERVGGTRCIWGARTYIRRTMEEALLIPNRHGTRRWNRKTFEGRTLTLRRHGTRYYFHPTVKITVAGATIVTVSRTSDDDLATVLTWKMLGHWIEESDPV